MHASGNERIEKRWRDREKERKIERNRKRVRERIDRKKERESLYITQTNQIDFFQHYVNPIFSSGPLGLLIVQVRGNT